WRQPLAVGTVHTLRRPLARPDSIQLRGGGALQTAEPHSASPVGTVARAVRDLPQRSAAAIARPATEAPRRASFLKLLPQGARLVSGIMPDVAGGQRRPSGSRSASCRACDVCSD